jgi:hypothetical protein
MTEVKSRGIYRLYYSRNHRYESFELGYRVLTNRSLFGQESLRGRWNKKQIQG